MDILWIILAALALLAFLVWYFFFRTPEEGNLIRLPLEDLDLKDIPAVPFSAQATLETALSLRNRTQQNNQAMNGLQGIFKIQGRTANARSFLFGQADNDDFVRPHEAIAKELEATRNINLQSPTKLEARLSAGVEIKETMTSDLTGLFLTRPEDFSLSWTHWAGVYDDSLPLLAGYAKTLDVSDEGVKAATEAFWPQIAENGQAFNLLLPQKLGRAGEDHPFAGKILYRIDLGFFENFEATTTDGYVRFTPGAIIDLYQDPETLNLVPYQIEVRGFRGSPMETFVAGDAKPGMWLYALQAAKAAVTTWGIWQGHVYHWHIVTAAMQYSMFTTEELTADHPLRRLLDPMSKYVIGFDAFLLLGFEELAPPTSFKSALDFLGLENFIARDRNYHDDDPIPTLNRLNLDVGDFTQPGASAWNTYPIVGRLLALWSATEKYVDRYVDLAWKTNDEVIADEPLHAWLRSASDPRGGNVKGLPTLDGPRARERLKRLLTSYLYRVTAHGSSRLNSAANPRALVRGQLPSLSAEQGNPCTEPRPVP